MTNYDRIKSMSIEEMSDFIYGISDIYDDDGFYGKAIDNIKIFDCCSTDIKEWLESEADVNEEND